MLGPVVVGIDGRDLELYDYAEKQSIWVKDGLNQGKNIFDYFEENKIQYYVPKGYFSDDKNLSDLNAAIDKGDITTAYITLGKLDGVMHGVGTTGSAVDQVMEKYNKAREREYC